MKRMLLGLWTVVACAPAQQEVTFPVHAVVRTVTAPHAVGAYTVTLARAQLGFGPVYWCATASAGAELCDQPLLEFAHNATMDLRTGEKQTLGEVRGYSGVVQSAQYDYALSWPLTSSSALALPAAPDGHALLLEGTVAGPLRTVAFRVEVDVAANRQGEMAVSYARTDAAVGAGTRGVTLDIPLAAWLNAVDWATVESQAGDDGTLRVTPDHPVAQALVLALTSNARPTFEWSTQP